MNTANAIALTQIILQVSTHLQSLIATQARAQAESRDVTDEELVQAQNVAQEAIDQLASRGT